MSKKIKVVIELAVVTTEANDGGYDFKARVKLDAVGVDNTDVLLIAFANALHSQLKNSLTGAVKNAYDTATVMKQLNMCERQDEED